MAATRPIAEILRTTYPLAGYGHDRTFGMGADNQQNADAAGFEFAAYS